MKYILALSLSILFSSQITKAQDDDLSTFHSSKSKKGSSAGVDASNAVYINIGSCLRGGATLGYQRHIVSGLAGYAELGVIVNDYIGRVDLVDNLYQGTNTYFTEVDAYRFGKMLSLGAKYYFDQSMGGSYLGLDYTNVNIINNKIVSTSALNNYQTVMAPTETVRLPYNSNEYKLLLGVSSSESNFYSDVNMGFGFRNVSYREIDTENMFTYYDGTQTVGALNYTTKYNSKTKLWFFFAVKLGYKF
jgi:hypothetical protein